MVDAAKLSSKRAIIQTDLELAASLQHPNIYQLSKAPHASVFPHCSVIVHHGGAGTTQAALLAGKPAIVVAHGFDQPYWGKQLQKQGVAGEVLYKSSVTAENLAIEINIVSKSTSMKERAKIISAKMKQENGIECATDLIEKSLSQLNKHHTDSK